MDYFEKNLRTSELLAQRVANRQFAHQFYCALCNSNWASRRTILQRITRRPPTYTNQGVSWRQAAAIVADMRNIELGVKEEYTDFYNTGGETAVSPAARQTLNQLGWFET